MDPIDIDLIWHSLGGGALVAGVLTLVRLVLDFTYRRNERRLEQAERNRVHQRDAEARLERVLQERLSDADRRLQRYQLEVEAERSRRVALEREFALLQQAHQLLSDQFGALQTDHAVLIGEHRLLLAASRSAGRGQL